MYEKGNRDAPFAVIAFLHPLICTPTGGGGGGGGGNGVAAAVVIVVVVVVVVLIVVVNDVDVVLVLVVVDVRILMSVACLPPHSSLDIVSLSLSPGLLYCCRFTFLNDHLHMTRHTHAQ